MTTKRGPFEPYSQPAVPSVEGDPLSRGVVRDQHEHSINLSTREKILEHLFVGDLLRYLWCSGIRTVEVLRAEVDAGGFDVAIECNGVLRHIQLKASHKHARTARVDINTALLGKPSGCVIWLRFDEESLKLGPFLWLGNVPGARLPDLGNRKGHHTKANSAGLKSLRPRMRTVNKGAFRSLASIDAVAEALFGELHGVPPQGQARG